MPVEQCSSVVGRVQIAVLIITWPSQNVGLPTVTEYKWLLAVAYTLPAKDAA